jgi:hypothetical protein
MSKLNAPQGFFISNNVISSEDILMNWTIPIIINMKKYGCEMIKEAQSLAKEFESNGELIKLKKVNSDIQIISKNIKKLSKAYSFAMN